MRDIELVSTNVNHETQVAAIFKRANRSLTLKFEDVIYKVKQKAANTSGEKGVEPPEKVILKGLTGKVVPGEMLAVLGPSGSGKTTLLTALGGKQLDGTVEGNITYNNKPFSNSLKRNMGFVAQDDVLFANLTVLETLVFTAFLRLPNSLTKQEKIMHAEAVISELGLDACKNTAIGGGFVRGVSGGERKRVSIGQEILINPSLLLLDEPTSGLDSTTAQRIVDCLWELGKGGRTIVITIHQPSSRLFYMFDKILLLSEGHPLYFGLGSEVMDYFAAVGFAPSVAMNPADFLLDLVNGISPNDKSRKNGTMVKQNLIDAYRTNLDKKVKAEVQAVDDDHVQDGNNDKQYPEERWATTWWEQFTVLLRRGVKERKHQTFTYVTVPQIFAVSILCGLIWWQSDISHLQDQIGLLFFTNGFWNFYPLYQAIFTILEERRMLAKERSSGMYRLSSYFMSRLISDLPMDLALPTMFMTITYWMSGLKRTAADFLLTLFAQLLNVVVSSGLGLALGALVVNPKVAATLGSVITLSFQLASGYYTQHVPSFIAWVKYLSIAQNTYKLLLGSQFKADETYPCGDHGDQICLVRDFPGIKVVGLDGQMYAVLALVIMFVGCRLIAYCALMSVGATKN